MSSLVRTRVLVIDDGDAYAGLVAEHMPEFELIHPRGQPTPRLPDGPAALQYLQRSLELAPEPETVEALRSAFDQAAQLEAYPARNAHEEVKVQILAASLANRRGDEAAELRHLGRAVEFQSLADDNNFQNRYIEQGQYLQILSRIEALQLDRMMLADAAATLEKIQGQATGTEIASSAAAIFAATEKAFHAKADVTVSAELTPIYRDGPGTWKTGLSRDTFSISNVEGKINTIFLVCDRAEKQIAYPSDDPWTIPVGWQQCKVDVSGRAGTRFILHQLISRG